MLSKLEAEVLRNVEVGKVYSLDELANLAKMNRDAVMKAIFLLQEKGFLEIYEVKKIKHVVSEEGKKYLKEGFPEEKLLKMLSESSDLEELKSKLGNEFQIAVGWLRRKNVLELKEGKIRLLAEPELVERRALEKLANGEEVDEEVLQVLEKRKLVERVEEKSFQVKILKKADLDLKEAISDLTPDQIISGSWKGKRFLKYDIRIPSAEIYGGKSHPYERIIRECRKIFLDMGFKEIKGNYVQLAFWNFDALFQPQDHPARDMQDTFYLDRYEEIDYENVEYVKETHENGWKTGSTGWKGVWDLKKAKQLVLRTHTTAVTIKYLAKNPEPPQKAFCIDRVYRRESIDATHLPEFDQLEGVVLDKEVGFSHLLGLLKTFFTKMGFEDVRFRPGYFPYTEPSVEPEVYVEGLGWIELGGAGVFRKEVTEPLGIKGKVLAWGLGIGRLAMLRIGLKDLRKLYLPDLNWLRSLPVVKR
ncbi:MAG: phenylalanine--tRNA ligase subunit alpha [Archaeoglobaceae archaeon]|nr:phenylalanine--tRNA ligase subunit alpha [Archaeoglobaceae archaeon]MDW8128289.1 phenylalanine--tRNA ligase subunit alpha [Archaeoglobaceae archaeon]